MVFVTCCKSFETFARLYVFYSLVSAFARIRHLATFDLKFRFYTKIDFRGQRMASTCEINIRRLKTNRISEICISQISNIQYYMHVLYMYTSYYTLSIQVIQLEVDVVLRFSDAPLGTVVNRSRCSLCSSQKYKKTIHPDINELNEGKSNEQH